MRIEIFEMQGIGEMTTDLDVLIINLHKKYADKLEIRKINIVDKELMKKHKDVVTILRDKGLESLPLIKKDGKLIAAEKLEHLLKKM